MPIEMEVGKDTSRSQVSKEMNCLSVAVEKLVAEVTSLEQILQPILTAEVEDKKITDVPIDTLVPLAKDIRVWGISILNQVNLLKHLKERIEL